MLLALLIAAAASTDEDLHFDLELGTGSSWARSICDAYGCPNAVPGTVRLGFGNRFASLGARASGSAIGQHWRSLLADLRFNTAGTTQWTFGLALGIGNLDRLQCSCDQHYGLQATGMMVIEGAIGLRTFALSADRRFHLGLDLRISSWAGGTTGEPGSDLRAPPNPVSTIRFLALLATIGASL
jgi:hypothetical protein